MEHQPLTLSSCFFFVHLLLSFSFFFENKQQMMNTKFKTSSSFGTKQVSTSKSFCYHFNTIHHHVYRYFFFLSRHLPIFISFGACFLVWTIFHTYVHILRLLQACLTDWRASKFRRGEAPSVRPFVHRSRSWQTRTPGEKNRRPQSRLSKLDTHSCRRATHRIVGKEIGNRRDLLFIIWWVHYCTSKRKRVKLRKFWI